MQINSSAFSNSLTGLQRSQSNLDNASSKVANAANPDTTNSSKNIQDGLIEATTSELEAQANVKVLEAANNTIGSLIDITV
ncbi:hypothetical protein [Marinomonas mediterranea]|jgi:hypothetical protein|uniref:Flagellar basal-body/hook protein C-terminal domain-containing protein n=1 Tax=Marinomonas mediterranea (strain ATCC 700492 / JCM 21426 / NBRC 103028 / MMB-1) TaxID=717774 RepID=F2JUV3_MARM1|nr:hypothetical protein [Marinomonas mediterranea]ADZ90518.1 hypothetical protein Marme_1245 [Marinomonas mediterranea MMB-1]WCN16697.1 hypothetical protein GV053_06300 [Marinomonas mediterranea MMB-1]